MINQLGLLLLLLQRANLTPGPVVDLTHFAFCTEGFLFILKKNVMRHDWTVSFSYQQKCGAPIWLGGQSLIDFGDFPFLWKCISSKLPKPGLPSGTQCTWLRAVRSNLCAFTSVFKIASYPDISSDIWDWKNFTFLKQWMKQETHVVTFENFMY